MRKALRWLPILVAAGFMLVFAQGTTSPNITKGSLQERVDALAAIQPGLGTVMIEYGNRMTNTYYAAKAGNWGLAQYQLKEALEIQETGEITRPNNAPMLKAVEDNYLKPLQQAILAKDWTGFQQKFDTAVSDGCNACHVATGHPFIQYQLPAAPAESYLNFNIQTNPKQ